MENINYDLTKLLHTTLDTVWRLENHYLADAKKANCKSVSVLEQILADEKKHAEMISQAIKERANAEIFN